MKVAQLDIHRRPVGKPRSGGVLTESLIIREPNSERKMAVGSQNQQLILHEVFPAVREVRDQDEGKMAKAPIHEAMSSMGPETAGDVVGGKSSSVVPLCQVEEPEPLFPPAI